MAISNTVIQIKKSGVTGNVPSSLNGGELALNYVDHKLFYKNASGGTSWFYGANNGPSFSTVSNGTSLITATAPNDTLTFATANGITITSNSSSKIITVGLSGITSTPTLNVTGDIPTISTTTGSLIVTGGVGVSGNVYANGIYAVSALYANGISVSGGGGTSTFPTLNVTGNITTTSNTTGSLIVTGGIGVSGNVYSTGSQSVFRGNVNIGNVVTNSNYTLDAASSSNDTTVRSFTSAVGAWFMAYSTSGYYAGVKYVGANGARNWFSGMGNNNQAYTIAMSIDSNSNRFFTIDTTGYISLAGAPGSESFRATPIANSVNYLQIAGAATGAMPTISSQGSDSNINMSYVAKGSGYHFFYGNNSAQFGIFPIANAVNYISVTGAATDGYPNISAQGSDTNIGLMYDAKGSGNQYFRAQSSAIQFAIGSTASAVNYMMAFGSTAGNYPVLTSLGSDTNIGFVFNSKGSGAVAFQTNYLLQAQVSYTANAVNFLNFTGGATGAAPTISTLSYTDANVSMNITSQGFGVTNINSGSGTIAKFQDRGTTTVNSPYIFKAGLAGTSSGVLTFPVSPNLQSPDPSDFTFNTNSGTGGGQGGSIQVVIGHTAPTVNYLRLTGSATNNAPSISALGSDSNINLVLTPKGTGSVVAGSGSTFSTSGGIYIGSSNNYIYQASANSLGFKVGTSPSYFQFTDNAGAIGLSTGNPFYFTGWAGTYTFAIAGPVNANAVNYLTVGTSVAGAGPTLYPNGSDANISLSLQPKGSGAINLVTGSKVNLGLGNSVSGIKIGNSGSGYTGFPTVVISASNAPSGGTTAVASAIGAMKVSNATVVSGGTGYAVNDVLTVVGGTTVTSSATLTVTAVSGNVITAVSSTNFGAYSVLPTGPVSTTSSSAGIGATFTLGYGIYSGTVSLSNVGSGYFEQPSISFTGAGTPTIAATGFATVGSIPIINTIGSGLSFNTPSGEQFRINDSNAPAVNYVQITGGASGISPSFACNGTDAAVGLSFATKSTGNMLFYSNGFNNTMLLLQAIASSVNYLNIRPSITNSPVLLTANGSDANVSIFITPKGTGNVTVTSTTASTSPTEGALVVAGGIGVAGAVVHGAGTVSSPSVAIGAGNRGFYNPTGGDVGFVAGGFEQVRYLTTTPAVNYLTMTGANTAAAPIISVAGSDSNINLVLSGKGTGFVRSTNQLIVGRSYTGNESIGIGGGTSFAVATNAAGIYNDINIDSTKTVGYTGFSTYVSTAAAAFNINTIAHYKAAFFTLGAGSSITNQYGFFADSSLSNATNNYGFYSSINAASGRYNFYAQGTADNVFAGQTSLGGVAGSESLRVVPIASGVNYIIATGAVTGATPKLTSSTTGIPVSIQGSHTWAGFSNASAAVGVNTDITNSVGAHVIFGSVNGNAPYIGATNYSTSSNGGLAIQTNGLKQFLVAHTASAVNYLQLTGAATGAYPTISAAGSDANVPLAILAKNNSPIFLSNGNGISARFFGGSNYMTIGGTGSGGSPLLNAEGSDANINLILYGKGTGVVAFGGSTVANSGFQVKPTTSAVNYLQATGAATTGAPELSVQGSDSNINLTLTAKGTGGVTTSSNVVIGSTNLTIGKLFVSGGSIVGDQSVLSRISGGLANESRGFRQSIDGTEYLALYDDNTSAILKSGGTTRLAINHGTGVMSLGAVAGSESLRVSPIANSVNYVAVQGSSTGQPVYISALGSDTNIALIMQSKGTQPFYFVTNNAIQFATLNTNSAINYLYATGGTTGGAGVLAATGNDANVSIFITPKGTGNVKVTSTTTSTSNTTGALVVSGGLGVSGNVYAGTIYASGAQLTTRPAVVVYSMIFGGS